MSGRRKNVMDIRESSPHMRNAPSHRGVQPATRIDRQTVNQHRKWAQEHGRLTGLCRRQKNCRRW